MQNLLSLSFPPKKVKSYVYSVLTIIPKLNMMAEANLSNPTSVYPVSSEMNMGSTAAEEGMNVCERDKKEVILYI